MLPLHRNANMRVYFYFNFYIASHRRSSLRHLWHTAPRCLASGVLEPPASTFQTICTRWTENAREGSEEGRAEKKEGK